MQVLGQDNIPSLVVASTTSVTIAATNQGLPTSITIGGQQYYPASTLTLTTSGTGANGLDTGALGAIQLWYVYAIRQATTFVPALVASLTGPATGPLMPSGYGTAYKLVGAFYTDINNHVGSTVPIAGSAVTAWMQLNLPAANSTSLNVYAVGSSNGLAFTNANVSEHAWRRNGTMVEIRGGFSFTGSVAGGTGGFNVLFTNFNYDTTDPVFTPAFNVPCGNALLAGGGNAWGFHLGVFTQSGNAGLIFVTTNGTIAVQFQPAASSPRATVNTDTLDYYVSFPVTAWTGKPTLL